MFCRYCGQEIEDNSKFCNKCGKSVDAKNAVEKGEIKPKVQKVGSKKLILLLGGAVALALLALFIYHSMFGLTITSNRIEAGSIVVLKDIINTKSPNASVVVKGDINTDKLGTQTVKCKVVNGVLSVSKKVKLSVVDTEKPIITGPQSIVVPIGETFKPEEYFSVEDFEKDLAKKIKVASNVNVNSEGSKKVTLEVEDSSGNKGEMLVTIKVVKLTTNEEKVLTAIKQYLLDGYSKNSLLSSVWIMKASGGTNGVDYYVQLTSDKIYAFYSNGSVSEFTVSDCGGTTMHDLMLYAIKYNGSTVSTSKLIN